MKLNFIFVVLENTFWKVLPTPPQRTTECVKSDESREKMACDDETQTQSIHLTIKWSLQCLLHSHLTQFTLSSHTHTGFMKIFGKLFEHTPRVATCINEQAANHIHRFFGVSFIICCYYLWWSSTVCESIDSRLTTCELRPSHIIKTTSWRKKKI